MKFLKYPALLILVFLISYAAAFGYNKFNKEKYIVQSLNVAVTGSPKTSLFSLENAPSESLKGKIEKMSGDIFWFGRVATEPARISSPIDVQQGENLATVENSELTLVFPDVLTILFSENTEIEVIQTLPSNLVFSQKSGTGTYKKTGDYPVSIRAKNLLVECEGEVVISINPDKPIVTLIVKSGNATAAYNDLDYVSHLINITERKTFTFNYDSRKAVPK